MLMKATCPSSIALGDVLKERNGDKIFIVLKTGDGQRWTHLIDIEHGVSEAHHRASPFKLKTDEVLRRLSFNVEQENALDLIPKLPLSVGERRRAAIHVPNRRSKESLETAANPTASRGWQLIWKLLTFDLPQQRDGPPPEASLHGDQFEELLDRRARAKRIERFCGVHTYSDSTVRRTFRRFCQRGLTPAAAGDDYDLCGGKGKVKNFTRKPGRRPRGRSLSGAARNEEIRRLLAMAADYYFTAEYRKGARASKSMKAAVRWLKTKIARRKVFDEDGMLVDLEFDDANNITARQLRYYIAQKYPYKDRRVHKVGLRQYLLHERPLTGRLSDTRGPGERYHIDATVIDVYPVVRNMRSVVARRPTLYLVVDDWSRMIVGVHLTFDPPCWNGAMMALVNAVSPKVEFCRGLGLDIAEKDWPASILCETLYADQGEMSSQHKATPLILHYPIQLSNAPAYRPDLRSVMEVRFRILPRTWMPLVPGAVEKNSFERGRKHPALDAALDITQLLQIVVMAILDYNTHAVTGYPTPPEMVEEKLAPTPLNLWDYGTKVNGCGRRINVAEFRAKVTSTEKARVTGGGLSFKGLTYKLPLSLVERQAMFRAEGKETLVEVGFDSSDNTTIELLGLGEPVSCPLADSVPHWMRGMSHHEWEVYNEQNNENKGNHEADIEKDRAMTEHNTSVVAKRASKETKEFLASQAMKHPDITQLDDATYGEREIDERARGVTNVANSAEVRKVRSALNKVTKGVKRPARSAKKSGQEEDAGVQQPASPVDEDFEVEEEGNRYLSISEEAEARTRELFEAF